MPFNTNVDFEVQDFWCHVQQSLSCYLAGASGTLLREWSCLLLSLFVSHYCPPAAHSQWEPRPEKSSSSSPPTLLFTTPAPLPQCSKHALKKSFFYLFFFFASKSYLIHCFPGTVEHWHTGWRAPQTGSYKPPERNDMVLMIENTAPNHSITSTYELWSFRL